MVKCTSGNYYRTTGDQIYFCVDECQYNYIVNYTNNASLRCVDNCYSNETFKFVNADSSECVEDCSSSYYNVRGDAMSCLDSCNLDTKFYGYDLTYFDKSMDRCEDSCAVYSTLKYTYN